MCAAQAIVVERPVPEGPEVELGLPGTFVARGVIIPFTTPALAGARARPAGLGDCADLAAGARSPRARLELLLPNPSGKSGIYVIEWEKIPQICCPTLFDRDLARRVTALPVITPAAVRGAAHRAGATGLAGEAVSGAAAHAAAAAQQERLFAHVALLMSLIRQGEERFGSADSNPGTATTLEGLERRARRAITGFVADLSLPEGSSETLGQAIEGLAACFGGVGLGPRAEEAYLARWRRAVAVLACDAGEAASCGCETARLVAIVAEGVARAVEALVRSARARADDVAGLLRDWSRDAAAVTFELTRAAWLLDGWERICGPRERWLTEVEWQALAALLPALPDEAASWVAALGGLTADLRRLQRRAAPCDDWRTGMALADLAAMNEQALARQFSCAGPVGARGIAA